MANLQVTEIDTRVAYSIGSTSQTTFSINFPFFQTKDLDVYVDGVLKSLSTDYTITTVAADDGGFLSGSLVFSVGQLNCTVSIVRNITQERTTDFPPSGGFNIRELNRQLDQLTAISQDLDRKIDQKIGFNETDFDDDVVNVSESATSRANKYLGFSSTGKSIVVKEGSTTGSAGATDASKVPLERQIATGTGLTGGGALSSDRTLSLQDVSPSPAGTFSNPTLTIDVKGRVTTAANGVSPISGGGAVVNLIAGTGLAGGGALTQDRTLALSATGVTAGSYVHPTSISVNAEGQVSGVVAGNASGPALATNTVTGTGALTGGGALSGNPQINMATLSSLSAVAGVSKTNATITVDAFGRVTNLASGSASGIGWVNMADARTLSGSSVTPNGNGTFDNAAVFTAAIAALPASGGVLYFPEGDWVVSTALTIPNKPVRIIGAGIDVCKIKFTGTTGGFIFNLSGSNAVQAATDAGHEATVSDLTLHTTNAGGVNNIALKFNGAFTTGLVDPSVSVDRVHFQGKTTTAYWYYHIYLKDCPHSKISNCLLDGQYVASGAQAQGTEAGIYVTSTAKATEHHISNTNVLLCKVGMDIQGSAGSEPIGFYLANNGFVKNLTGIKGTAVSGSQGLQVTNSHFNNKNHSITGYFQQLILNGNLFYAQPESVANSVILQVTAAGGTHSQFVSFIINNNHFVNNSTSTGVFGIVLGTDGEAKKIVGTNISGNHFQWSGNQPVLVIRNNCERTTVSGNSLSGTGTNVFANSATQNIICNVSKRAALYVPDSALGSLVSTRTGNTASVITNNAIDLTPQTSTAIYDTGSLTGSQNIGSGGTRTVIKIPADGSVRWVRVGAEANFRRDSASGGFTGGVHLFVKHYASTGVHYKADTTQGAVGKDYASNNGTLPGAVAHGLAWEGVCSTSNTSQVQSTASLSTTSGLVRVYPNDYFYLVLGNTSGVDVTLEQGAQIWMEVIEGI